MERDDILLSEKGVRWGNYLVRPPEVATLDPLSLSILAAILAISGLRKARRGAG